MIFDLNVQSATRLVFKTTEEEPVSWSLFDYFLATNIILSVGFLKESLVQFFVQINHNH